MRFAPIIAVVSTFLPVVLCLPIVSERGSDLSIHRREYPGPSFDVFERDDGLDLDSRDIDDVEEIYQRSRGALKAAKQAAKATRVAKAAAKGKTSPKRPANAKVTFGNAAKAHLDELGLHGKDRKKVKKYHKQVVKQDMKNHGAHSARVFHLAHTGGSDPNEKNHITAGYYKAPTKQGHPGEQIKSPWAIKHEKENPGKVTKGLFHVYPSEKKKVPSSWTKAAESSASRKKAEADRHAAATKAEEEAKHRRVEAERLAGGSLSAEAKKAQREAAKAAKAAKKLGKKE
ncbi:hypothetical protein JR316_0012947 [Psilocybe cubensis]|uniref:Uncharacterized protein n=2 Tax=Psilocybe cubensis TaxID=181762 RepID=A0ACB8GFV7_PSICU|nr:hypothetical protein JR316_0012947 [Psilocybe cubensis]KAH9474488.1 hypothetical protein JR316_0012947 [Psilocybe cubensis]